MAPERLPDPGADSSRRSAAVRLDEAVFAARPTDRIERLFGSHQFFRLWVAQLISATGDWLGLVATIALAARLSEGSEGAAIALVLASRVAPGFFLATAAGVLVDRLDRKRVMVACDLGRAAVLVSLPFVDTLLGLVAASFVLELLTMMWQPAKEAIVPNIVPKEKLTSANALNVAAAYGMFPVAVGIAAVLSKAAEAVADEGWVTNFRLNEEGLAFYVDALTFLVTAAIVARMAIGGRPDQPHRGAGNRGWDLGGAFRELREGWHLVAANPIVRSVNVGLATGIMGGGMLVPLGAIFVDEVIVGREADFHLVLFALGMGMALGVAAASALQNRINRPRVFAGALVGAGLALLTAASFDLLSVVALATGMLGFMGGPVYVLGFTMLHENVADEMRGRVFAALLVLVRLCLLVALALSPLVSDLLDRASQRWWDGDVSVLGAQVQVPGVRLTMWLAGLIIVGAGILTHWSLKAGARAPVSGDPGGGDAAGGADGGDPSGGDRAAGGADGGDRDRAAGDRDGGGPSGDRVAGGPDGGDPGGPGSGELAAGSPAGEGAGS